MFDSLPYEAPSAKRSRLSAGSETEFVETQNAKSCASSQDKPSTSNSNDDEEFYEYYYQMKDCHEDLLKEIENQLEHENSELDIREKELLAQAEVIVNERSRHLLLKKERQELRHRQSLMAKANREKSIYCCFVCSKAFLDEELARQHVANVHLKDDEKYFLKCKYCYMRFSRKRNLDRHMETHKRSRHGYFECNQCKSVYKEEISLAIHKSQAHSTDIDDNPLTKKHHCECGQTFGLEQEYKRHHYYCKNKESILAKRKLAKDRIIAGSTPVSPAVSVSSMSTTSSALSPSGRSVKDKSCPFCYLVCASMQSRDRHIKRKHPDLADSEAAQHTHVVVDSPNLPFACKQCSKRFASHSSLSTHVKRIHEKKLDHVCEICSRGYPLASELRKHIKRVHENVSSASSPSQLQLDEF